VNKFIREKVIKDEKRITAIDDNNESKIYSQENFEDDAYSLLNKDEVNERALVRCLLEFGLKEWQPAKTVAEYILYDVIDEDMIDDKKLMEIINTYKTWYEAKLEPTEKTFLYHEDQQMAMLVMSILEFPYEVSNGWKEQFDMPVPTREDTYKEEVFSTVNYLKLRKIKRLISMNEKDLEKSHTEDELFTILQTAQLLKNMEIEMTKKMGTVILR